jgi:transglutaminase-like putative cysteine protease
VSQTFPHAFADVGAHVVLDVPEPSVLAFQVVAAHDHGSGLAVTLDGAPVAARVVDGPEPWARQQLVACGPGRLEVWYDARVRPGPGDLVEVDEVERIVMLRPSRYCPSDRLVAFCGSRFPGPDAPALERLQAVTDYVHDHLAYVAGSTGPTDDAVDVLLSGQGVCRDYAHVVVTLARAAGMAARLVAVYAPGLTPMDFHAVAEVEVDGRWHVVDATRLAPRESLVRIATGRDAADTAWLTTVSGFADLADVTVTAVAGNGLPLDDGSSPTVLT